MYKVLCIKNKIRNNIKTSTKNNKQNRQENQTIKVSFRKQYKNGQCCCLPEMPRQ